MSKGTEGLFSMVHGALPEASEAKQNNGAQYREASLDMDGVYALRATACLALGVSLSGFGATTTAGGMAVGCLEIRVSISADPEALCPLLQSASFSSLIPA